MFSTLKLLTVLFLIACLVTAGVSYYQYAPAPSPAAPSGRIGPWTAEVAAFGAEEASAREIERRGWNTRRDRTKPGNPVVQMNLYRVQVPDEAWEVIGNLKSLTALHLYGDNVTDAGMKEIGKLTNLTSLTLERTHVADAGLREIGKLTNLTSLRLIGGFHVTGTGVKHLANLQKLTALDLYNCHNLTDDAAMYLATLPNLNVLILDNSLVTVAGRGELQKALPKCSIYHASPALSVSEEDAVWQVEKYDGAVERDPARPGSPIVEARLMDGREYRNVSSLSTYQFRDQFVALGRLKHLTLLDVRNTPMENLWLSRFTTFKHLTSLNLSKTDVTDAGLLYVGDMENLTSLDVSGNKITDAGLKELANLKRLTSLDLSDTLVTDAGVRELRLALPGCTITSTAPRR